jgi:large subunit ribosomal protein L35
MLQVVGSKSRSDVAQRHARSLLIHLKENEMPKMKTKSGAKKRFKFLGNGKVKRTHSHLRHILTKKTTKQKRKLRGTAIISSTDVKRVRAMMPTQ